LQRQITQLRRDFSGFAIRGGAVDPPVVNERPFYPLVVTLDLDAAGSETFITTADLIKGITGQLGLTTQAAVKMVIRVKSIRGWAYMYGGSTDRVSINGELSSLVPNVSDFAQQTTVNPAIVYPIIYKFRDFGSLNQPAHFGYVYPRSMQQVILGQDANFNIATLASNSTNGTVHIHLEWSTAEVQPGVEP
jgi:hypothetical protein